jgi:hypothetical protein
VPVILEALGTRDRVEHRVALPASRAEHAVDQCRAVMPGLAIEEVPGRPPMRTADALSLRLTTKRRPLRVDDPASASRALLTALAHVGKSERLVLQWVLGRPCVATPVPNRLSRLAHESWIAALLSAPFDSSAGQTDVELRNALRAKQGEAGWRAIGRLAVEAASVSRRRQLLRQLFGALGASEAPGVRFYARRTSTAKIMRPERAWRWPLRLNTRELGVVAAFPVGVTADLPVSRSGSRLVAPSAAISRTGRIIGESVFPGRERPLAVSITDSLRHMHLIGPSGSGKSTLLANLVAQDIGAGRAVVVVDPKGDLIDDILSLIPKSREKDTVVLDPTDVERPVGLNPLNTAGRSPDLVADQVLGLFHAQHADSWGPRMNDILGAALLTLARTPGMTLTALPVLLTNAAFRRRIVAKVSDPVALGPFWSSYEAWSEDARLAAIAPIQNKLRPLLMRPELRCVVGQSRPRFDLRQVFTERKLLLVNLAAGQLGPEASSLLGSLVVSQLWQAILERSAIPRERRHPVSVVLDEFQTYMHLPVDLAEALAQARGMGVGFAVAHQLMHQLSPQMRSSVLANAQSRVAFRLPSEDARVMAAGSGLDPEDFQSLGAYECYAQLVADAAVQPWCSLRTLPPMPSISDPAKMRELSRQTYGVSRAQIEADLADLLTDKREASGNDLRPRRRTVGGAS